MTTFKLHPDTQMGAVSLNIRNMERSLKFYTDNIGLQVHRQDGDRAYLGTGKDDLLILNEKSDAPPLEAHSGLYHFAILVPSRVELAKSLRHLIETETPVDGFADHIVSEAIYLPDPDGIGIEIYRDLPRDTWEIKPNGEMNIGTLALDLQSVLDELSPADMEWQGLHADTTIGHVHLNTGQNPNASRRFYTDMLGFDVMMSVGGYWHFVAAGGYHHHLGLRPAGMREDQSSIGLNWYAIDLPDETALRATVDHLQSNDVTVTETDLGYHLYDHANNGIQLRKVAN